MRIIRQQVSPVPVRADGTGPGAGHRLVQAPFKFSVVSRSASSFSLKLYALKNRKWVRCVSDSENHLRGIRCG